MSPEGLGHPSIRAELDGLAGEFMLDTGAGSQILVSEQFEREHAPLARYGKVLTFLAPGGIGGRANMRLGLGKQLRIGPLTLSPPRVASTVDADAMNRRGSGFAHTAGIGGGNSRPVRRHARQASRTRLFRAGRRTKPADRIAWHGDDHRQAGT
jgi:hypothetical protein